MSRLRVIRILEKELDKIDFSGLSEENLEKVQRYVELYTAIAWLKSTDFHNYSGVQQAWNNIAKGWETIFDEDEKSENN
nr:hypothetical protein DBT53_01965 [Aerococcus mictus]